MEGLCDCAQREVPHGNSLSHLSHPGWRQINDNKSEGRFVWN